LIREHLKVILASRVFTGSKQSQLFLKIIVEHALAGEFDDLRERMIGAKMFKRPIDYDTANDAVVRVKATEVRRKLAQFYLELREKPAIRIELPSGSYVPKFHWESLETAAPPQVGIDAQQSAQPVMTPEEPGAVPAAGSRPGQSTLSRRRLVLASLVFALGVVATIGYLGFKHLPKTIGTEPGTHSIVVLPLQNFSGDPKQEYFADSMTEELITDLGQIAALRVISRTSAMTYKGTSKPLPQIARELGVDTVVEGSVLREGNRVRITAQLIDARTDHHIWANAYTREATGVLTMEGEVARAIADQVSIEVTPQEQARLARIRIVDPEAQKLYFQGSQSFYGNDPVKAIDFLQKAIGKDPNFAQPHALLANCYGWMGEYGWMPQDEAFRKGKEEAVKAVELDDALAEAHSALGYATMNRDWDWATAEKEFKRGLELNPNSVNIHWVYAYFLAHVGRFPESLAQTGLALQLDPVSSRAYIWAANHYIYARQYDQARALIARASSMPHGPLDLLYSMGQIELEAGHYEETIQILQKLGDFVPPALGPLGYAYARVGNTAAARQVIEKLRKRIQQDGFGRYEIASVYAGLGQKDEAFHWLEEAYRARDRGAIYLKLDPCMDPLITDPRFQDLLRRVGLPA
jgi:TolB-like protein/Flp pilus assembly protein TadD